MKALTRPDLPGVAREAPPPINPDPRAAALYGASDWAPLDGVTGPNERRLGGRRPLTRAAAFMTRSRVVSDSSSSLSDAALATLRSQKPLVRDLLNHTTLVSTKGLGKAVDFTGTICPACVNPGVILLHPEYVLRCVLDQVNRRFVQADHRQADTTDSKRQTNRQADIQTHSKRALDLWHVVLIGETDNQTDRQSTDRQTDRQTHTHTHTHTHPLLRT